MRFSQTCWWQLKSSGTLCHLDCLTWDMKTMVLRNGGNYLVADKVQHPRRLWPIIINTTYNNYTDYIIWDVMACWLVICYRHFRGAYYFHFLCRWKKISWQENKLYYIRKVQVRWVIAGQQEHRRGVDRVTQSLAQQIKRCRRKES